MLPKLKILDIVIERIRNINNPCRGALYGIMYDRTLLVIGFTLNKDSIEGVEPFLEMQMSYPTGIDFCGIISFLRKPQLDPSDNIAKDLKEVFVTDNPVLIQKCSGSDDIGAYIFRNERLTPVTYSVLNSEQFFETFVILRLQTSLLLLSDINQEDIIKEVENLQKVVSSGGTVFHFKNTNTYIYRGKYDDNKSECQLGHLYDSSELAKDCRQNKGVLLVSMLLQSSGDLFEDPETYAPFVTADYFSEASDKMVAMIPIDGLCLAQRSRSANDSYGLLIDTACRSLHLFQTAISQFVDKANQIRELRQYHFFPPQLGHYVSLVFPQISTDQDLYCAREKLHKQMHLPMDVPVFRKGNGLVFKNDLPTSKSEPLMNVHEGLKSSSVKGGRMFIVKGYYSYHHYLQDSYNDDGWGCAYRSLQTLFSWFRWQGYTHKAVPSHYDIQKCLVDIRDKMEDFIGSRQWIGSTEVAFCLDSMLGVTSKIIAVSSGHDLDSKADELMYHFQLQGTPIMIGGGVLAHTILGIDYNQETEELKYLVLDPHYTGPEELKIIQNKGWVGWKGKEFWDKKSFYNLCLPQRPQTI